jgi:hypothetical protein
LVLPPGSLLPQHVAAERNREPIGALKFILNIFVDKKQVPILIQEVEMTRDKKAGSYHP